MAKKKGFQLDYDSAISFIKEKHSNDEADWSIRINYIKSFDCDLDNYSRQGKDDRSYTYFISLPSNLKQFITYRDSKLVEVDIKSSQP